jgi:hypothetical protein
MLVVERYVDVAADPASVWTAVGAFGAIAEWHPLVSACSLSLVDQRERRTLTLGDGSVLVEDRTDDGLIPFRYEYCILAGPLPVQAYEAQFSVVSVRQGSQVLWRGHFEALGVADDVARAKIDEVFRLGLDAIYYKLR